jgi:hypothetical protein
MSEAKTYILNKYGPMLTREQVAEIFNMTPDSLSNAISSEKILLSKQAINSYHYADVAAAVDRFATSPLNAPAGSGYIAPGSANPNGRIPPPPRRRISPARTGAKSPRA